MSVRLRGEAVRVKRVVLLLEDELVEMRVLDVPRAMVALPARLPIYAEWVRGPSQL